MKELLKKLIAEKSTQDVGEADCAKVLADFFLSAGMEAKVDVWDSNRANLSVSLKSAREKPALLFVGHLDVVPAQQSSAFAATEQNGKIFGRGSCDMKGGLAAIAAAITEIFRSKVKLKGDLIFAATAGEETDDAGIERFLESYAKDTCEPGGCIVPEPTNFEIVTAHRGLLWLEIKTKGKTAHSSMPQLGINAIESIRLFLNELANYGCINTEPDKLLGHSSISVNKINGGTAGNIVPDSCSAQIDIRTLPGQNHSHIIKDFEKIFSELSEKNDDFQAEINVLRAACALQTDPDCEFVSRLKKLINKDEIKAATFTTDAPFIAQLNIPVVVFGPGRPEFAHKPDEYIEIGDLQKGADFYKKIILHFLT